MLLNPLQKNRLLRLQKKPQPAQKSGPKLGRSGASQSAETSKTVTPDDKGSAHTPSPAATTGSGLGGNLGAGLAGAVLAFALLGLVGMFDWANKIPVFGSLYGGASQSSTSVEVLERLEALETEERAVAVEQLNDVDRQLSELRAQIDGLAVGSGNPESQAALVTFSERLSGLEAKLGDLAVVGGQQGPDVSGDLSAVE